MILYEFSCDEHGRFEAFSTLRCRDDGSSCPKCGSVSKRVQTPTRFKLEGVSGHFPTASMQWDERHIRAGKHSDYE